MTIRKNEWNSDFVNSLQFRKEPTVVNMIMFISKLVIYIHIRYKN